MAEAPILKARRSPRQTRSQITVTAILDATVRVLLRRGYQDCTTNLVAEVAGVGIGSLYEYFPNKEALVAAVIEREIDRFIGVLEREMFATFDEPFAEALRAWLDAALAALEQRQELLRILFAQYPYMGQLSAVARLPHRITELAAFCLRRWGNEVCVTDLPATYYVLANMLAGAYCAQTLRPSVTVTRTAMLDASCEILLRVLKPNEPARVARVRASA